MYWTYTVSIFDDQRPPVNTILVLPGEKALISANARNDIERKSKAWVCAFSQGLPIAVVLWTPFTGDLFCGVISAVVVATAKTGKGFL
jgi:hypothetical protein